MTQLILETLPIVVLMFHALLVVVLAALIFRRSWGGKLASWVGKHGVVLGLLVSLSAVLGSLFYSSIAGYAPCVLCWWQRVFLFPLVIIFAVAMIKKIYSAYLFAVPMAVIGGLIALYHAQSNLGGASVLPCTATGAECSKLYVMAFGYITIPTMSLTIAIAILLLAWAKKIYDNNSHA